MKVPISWLKDFVDITISEKELADKLVSCGFEIEEIIYQKEQIKKVVTGRILTIEKHPNADKLAICCLDIGNGTTQVVTAATNIKVGDIVPMALDGALLAGDKTIHAGELRGIKSCGMLCSGAELDLTENDFAGAGVHGILILPEDTAIGADINDIIGSNDIILDISITANRQDCNSILGIAREVAAVTNQKVKYPDFSFESIKSENIKDCLSVENKAYELCSRYMARVVRNVVLTSSPDYIKRRLKAVGIRPINNLVDVTNYVLIEIGQPLHAFDLDLLENKKIVVRTAQNDEKIVALDGKEYLLKDNNLVICDAKKPVAVAGVMGGEYSSVNNNTKSIAMESANFARDSVRRTSKQLNLRSDSSLRFEKSIDFLSQEAGLNRVLSIIDKNGWGKVVDGVIDSRVHEIKQNVINLHYQEINKVLGIVVPKQTIVDILNSLEFVTEVFGDNLKVTVPLYRTDVVGVNDLAEEVIRIYGYDHIKPTMLSSTEIIRGGKTAAQKRVDKTKGVLTAHGAFELVSYSFVSPKAFDLLHLKDSSNLRNAIKILNPLGVDFSVMRTTLSYSMIKIIAANLLRGNKSARFFEVAKTYIPKELPLTDRPIEKYKLCIGAYGDGEDFYSIKAIIDDMLSVNNLFAEYTRADIEYLHPGRSANILINGKNVGYVGEVFEDVAAEFDIDKRIYIAELDWEYILDNAPSMIDFKPMSKYQAMERDLALVVSKDTAVKSVLDIIKQQGGEILEDCDVFDIYEGDQVPKGQKSVAIKLNFRHMNRTLTDEEVSVVIDNMLSKLSEINARLR